MEEADKQKGPRFPATPLAQV